MYVCPVDITNGWIFDISREAHRCLWVNARLVQHLVCDPVSHACAEALVQECTFHRTRARVEGGREGSQAAGPQATQPASRRSDCAATRLSSRNMRRGRGAPTNHEHARGCNCVDAAPAARAESERPDERSDGDKDSQSCGGACAAWCRCDVACTEDWCQGL